MTDCHINRLPAELLQQVFAEVTDLNAAPPSSHNFSLDPSDGLTKSDKTPLKTLSLICRRWREAVLPSLFRHGRLELSSKPRWARLCLELRDHLQANCKKTSATLKLIKLIEGLACVHQDTHEDQILGFSFLDHEVDSVPSRYRHWLPSSREADDFLSFISSHHLIDKVKTLVIHAHQSLANDRSSPEQSVLHAEVRALWRSIFGTLQLDQVIVAAPPSTIAPLSGGSEHEVDSWLFRIPYHYLRLSKSAPHFRTKNQSPPASPPNRGREVFLYNIAMWDHIGYNEGTHLRGYGHYEYQWKKPSDVFRSLIEWLAKERACPKTPKIRSVEYIAAFPYSSHVFNLARSLSSLQDVRQLTVSLANPDLLSDQELMGKAQPSDVYSEWEECYHHIARNLLATAAKGTVFIAKDTKHVTLREQVVRCVERRTLMPTTYAPVIEERDGIMSWMIP